MTSYTSLWFKFSTKISKWTIRISVRCIYFLFIKFILHFKFTQQLYSKQDAHIYICTNREGKKEGDSFVDVGVGWKGRKERESKKSKSVWNFDSFLLFLFPCLAVSFEARKGNFSLNFLSCTFCPSTTSTSVFNP